MSLGIKILSSISLSPPSYIVLEIEKVETKHPPNRKETMKIE